jgi:WD40 repeat protein
LRECDCLLRRYHPDESQLLTTGSDRKITYWDAYDGSAIRILDGSQSAELNSLAVTASGDAFVSAGADKVVKVRSTSLGFRIVHRLARPAHKTPANIRPTPEGTGST